MWIRSTLTIVAALALVVPTSASDSISSKQADDILAELRKIRVLLENNGANRIVDAPPARVTLDLKSAAYMGSQDAQLSIVEFMDYQCPYCKQFQAQTFQNLKRVYIDTGKLRFGLSA